MKRRNCGFTLLELLISLTLMGFIFMLLFSGFQLGIRSWDSADARSEQNADFLLGRNFLRRALTQAVPFHRENAPDSAIAFVGRPDAIDFVGPLPAQLGYGGYRHIELRIVRGESGSVLTLRHGPIEPDAPPLGALDPETETIILDHLRSAEFAYYGTAVPTDQKSWMPVWEKADHLPAMIRLVATPAEDTVWPELAVIPRLSAESECRWDDFYKKCR